MAICSYSASLIMSERQRFEKAIIRAKGNRADAAKDLGISRATFFRRAKELGLVKSRTEGLPHLTNTPNQMEDMSQ